MDAERAETNEPKVATTPDGQTVGKVVAQVPAGPDPKKVGEGLKAAAEGKPKTRRKRSGKTEPHEKVLRISPMTAGLLADWIGARDAASARIQETLGVLVAEAGIRGDVTVGALSLDGDKPTISLTVVPPTGET